MPPRTVRILPQTTRTGWMPGTSVMRALSHYWRLTREDNAAAHDAARAGDRDRSPLRPGARPARHQSSVQRPHGLGGQGDQRDRSPSAPRWPQFGPTARIPGRTMPWAAFTCSRGASRMRWPNSEHALRLNPNFCLAHGYYGLALGFCGRWKEGEEAAHRALRLSPRDPFSALYYGSLPTPSSSDATTTKPCSSRARPSVFTPTSSAATAGSPRRPACPGRPRLRRRPCASCAGRSPTFPWRGWPTRCRDVEVRVEDRLALGAEKLRLGLDPLARLLLFGVVQQARFQIRTISGCLSATLCFSPGSLARSKSSVLPGRVAILTSFHLPLRIAPRNGLDVDQDVVVRRRLPFGERSANVLAVERMVGLPLPPARASSVGMTSTMCSGSLTTAGLSLAGQLTNAGTRTPPSCSDALAAAERRVRGRRLRAESHAAARRAFLRRPGAGGEQRAASRRRCRW